MNRMNPQTSGDRLESLALCACCTVSILCVLFWLCGLNRATSLGTGVLAGLILLLFSSWPAARAGSELFYRRGRERRGLCRRCGYDLRSSHHICPECGFDHIWQRQQTVISPLWCLAAGRRTAEVLLVFSLLPAIGSGVLCWQQASERRAMAQLKAAGFVYKTEPVRPAWLPDWIEPSIEPLLERVVYARIVSAGTDGALRHLAALTSLRELNLGNSYVTDAGLAQLKGLPRLKILTLSNTSVTLAGIGHLRRSLPDLMVQIPVTQKGTPQVVRASPALDTAAAPPGPARQRASTAPPKAILDAARSGHPTVKPLHRAVRANSNGAIRPQDPPRCRVGFAGLAGLSVAPNPEPQDPYAQQAMKQLKLALRPDHAAPFKAVSGSAPQGSSPALGCVLGPATTSSRPWPTTPGPVRKQQNGLATPQKMPPRHANVAPRDIASVNHTFLTVRDPVAQQSTQLGQGLTASPARCGPAWNPKSATLAATSAASVGQIGPWLGKPANRAMRADYLRPPPLGGASGRQGRSRANSSARLSPQRLDGRLAAIVAFGR